MPDVPTTLRIVKADDRAELQVARAEIEQLHQLVYNLRGIVANYAQAQHSLMDLCGLQREENRTIVMCERGDELVYSDHEGDLPF